LKQLASILLVVLLASPVAAPANRIDVWGGARPHPLALAGPDASAAAMAAGRVYRSSPVSARQSSDSHPAESSSLDVFNAPDGSARLTRARVGIARVRSVRPHGDRGPPRRLLS